MKRVAAGRRRAEAWGCGGAGYLRPAAVAGPPQAVMTRSRTSTDAADRESDQPGGRATRSLGMWGDSCHGTSGAKLTTLFPSTRESACSCDSVISERREFHRAERLDRRAQVGLRRVLLGRVADAGDRGGEDHRGGQVRRHRGGVVECAARQLDRRCRCTRSHASRRRAPPAPGRTAIGSILQTGSSVTSQPRSVGSWQRRLRVRTRASAPGASASRWRRSTSIEARPGTAVGIPGSKPISPTVPTPPSSVAISSTRSAAVGGGQAGVVAGVHRGRAGVRDAAA